MRKSRAMKKFGSFRRNSNTNKKADIVDDDRYILDNACSFASLETNTTGYTGYTGNTGYTGYTDYTPSVGDQPRRRDQQQPRQQQRTNYSYDSRDDTADLCDTATATTLGTDNADTGNTCGAGCMANAKEEVTGSFRDFAGAVYDVSTSWIIREEELEMMTKKIKTANVTPQQNYRCPKVKLLTSGLRVGNKTLNVYV